jgi:uncharacterized protein YegJ (DUF2314 family)
MGLWSWLSGFYRGTDRPPQTEHRAQKERLVALVLFLRRSRDLDTAAVAALAESALGGRFRDDQPDAADRYVAGHEPSFVIKYGDHFILINTFPRPYMDDPNEAAGEIGELRLRKAVRDHEAWVSVDLLGECKDAELPDVYRTLGKLAAELIDDDCLALFAPATGQLVVYDPEMLDALRGPDPLDLFEKPAHPPVVPVNGDDPRLKAAVAKARRRWDEFVAAFEQRQPEQSFSAKARIGDGENYEFMWLSVTGLENGIIYGRLDNDPIDITSIRCGDRVRVAVKELNDWLYTEGDEVHGGFTIDVLRKIQEEMQQD